MFVDDYKLYAALPDDLANRLKAFAASENKKISVVAREALDAYLPQLPTKKRRVKRRNK